jgi:hypothetical protein
MMEPEYIGGLNNFYSFIKENYKIPNKLSGDIQASFVIGKDGRLNEVIVTKGLKPKFDQELIRVLNLSPKWLPAEIWGKKTSIPYNLFLSIKAETIPKWYGKKTIYKIDHIEAKTDTVKTENKVISNKTEDIMLLTGCGIEVKPSYIGGINKFHTFIKKNYTIPRKAKKLNGEIQASFIIERDGNLDNIKLLKDIGEETGKELIRVLETSEKWNPGLQNGKPVRNKYYITLLIKNEILKKSFFRNKYTSKIDSIVIKEN